MAEKAYYVTEEGLAALQAELEDLKVNRRKEVAEKLKKRFLSPTFPRTANMTKQRTIRLSLRRASPTLK